MAKQSVYRGAINIGKVKIPVCVYGTADLFGIEGHLYHEDCGGKIREARYCELHPDLEGPVSYSGIDIGSQIIKVDSELRNALLDRKAPFVVRSAHKLSEFGSFMASGALMPLFMYEVSPEGAGDPAFSIQHDALVTLWDRMEKKKVFMLCSIGLAGINRLAILLPGGLLYVLTYREELREFTTYSGNFDRPLSNFLDEFITAKSTKLPTISLAKYRKRVADWFAEVSTPHVTKKVKTNPKKQTKAKVGSNA